MKQQTGVKMKHVVVAVLGDLGRSPRMQYHALSLAAMPSIGRVTLVGYAGEAILHELSSHPKVSVEHIQQPAIVGLFRHIRVLFALVKGLGLLWSFCRIMLALAPFDLVVVQNPPALPVLIACGLLSFVRRFKLLLDWHNLGFSMYAHSLGEGHVLTRLSRVLERYLCHVADYHICVSNAMKTWLKANFDVSATVCHDKPAQIFSGAALPVERRHALLSKLGFQEKRFQRDTAVDDDSTIQTLVRNGAMERKGGPGRVALAVSCTSWTSDEDFGLLLRSLLFVEAALRQCGSSKGEDAGRSELRRFDRLLVVITGKGELRAPFEELLRDAERRGLLGEHVFVQTAWLETADYPVLLQCADLGISLHASTSGLDLPMKVVDMFGAGLPVCALEFPTLPELVTHEHNGLVFRDDRELSKHMLSALFSMTVEGDAVFSRDTLGGSVLEDLKQNLQGMERWNGHWERVMRPLVEVALR